MRFETINLGVPGPPGPASIVPGPIGPEGPQGIPGPPGGESGSVNGVLSLREIEPVDGQTLHLNYHTTVGDLGGGAFRSVTGAAAGTYIDNGGTIIVPTGGDGSTAWLRVWDGLTAHVGWFGATCDRVTDDYAAVKKCFDLFTDGRSALRTGAIDVGPGFAFATPLVYGGSVGHSIRILGHQSLGRGTDDVSVLKYIGPPTIGAIFLYGANESVLERVNVFPYNALNGVVVTSDNGYIATLSASVTAGVNVVATPSNMTYLQAGVFVGVDAGGPNFEIVYMAKVTGSTFTATFTKNHAAGVALGGSASSSGTTFQRCRFICPYSPVWTTLTTNNPGGGTQVFTPASMAGIGLGMPIRIGSFVTSEIVYPTAVTGSTFTAVCTQSHVTGERVMYATSGVLLGNNFTATVQVSEITFNEVSLTGATLIDRCYSGIRQTSGGNTKNVICHNIRYAFLVVAFAFEASSGQYLISGCVGAAVTDTVIVCGAVLTVISLEDESTCMLLRGQAGSSPIHATLIGCTIQSAVPIEAFDELVVYSGALTFIGCYLQNGRTGSSLPVIVVLDMRFGVRPGSLALINCFVRNATETSAFVKDGAAGSGVDVIADGTGKLTMLGCTGGVIGTPVGLPSILPPVSRWQNTATGIDPPSLVPGTVDAIRTMTVSGAVLGDLVEASFSLNLQGATLRAWVSAADTVSYQFAYPLGSLPNPLDLGSGTVKCRVKK